MFKPSVSSSTVSQKSENGKESDLSLADSSKEKASLKDRISKELQEVLTRRRKVTTRIILEGCKSQKPQTVGVACSGVGAGGQDTVAAEYFPGYHSLEELLLAMNLDLLKV